MIELNKTNFEQEVLAPESGTVLVDFFSEGCEPCKALMPFVHDMAEKYGDKLKFAALDTMKARRVAIGQQVLGLPVIAIYQNGAKTEELVKDDATPEAIEAMIQKYI